MTLCYAFGCMPYNQPSTCTTMCSLCQVVKQSVMTTVYGVTEYGTFKQVMKQLADQIPDHPLKWRKQAANYISDRIADSMGTIFSSSTQIQVQNVQMYLYLINDCFMIET